MSSIIVYQYINITTGSLFSTRIGTEQPSSQNGCGFKVFSEFWEKIRYFFIDHMCLRCLLMAKNPAGNTACGINYKLRERPRFLLRKRLKAMTNSPRSHLGVLKKDCVHFCGATEIRTRDTLLGYTRFPGVPLQPLEHRSLLYLRCKGTHYFLSKRCFWEYFYLNVDFLLSGILIKEIFP